MKAEHLPRYIDRRMKELSVERFSEETISLYLPAGADFVYNAWNRRAFFWQEAISPAPLVSVESNFGYLSEGGKHTVQQWEHCGQIRFRNQGSSEFRLSFILISPHP